MTTWAQDGYCAHFASEVKVNENKDIFTNMRDMPAAWFFVCAITQKENNSFGLLFFLLVVLVATTWAQGYELEGRITRR